MSDHQAAQWPIHSWHTHAAAASDQTTHHHHLEAVDDEPQQQSPTATTVYVLSLLRCVSASENLLLGPFHGAIAVPSDVVDIDAQAACDSSDTW